MCPACGCGDTKLVPVELHERLLADNDRTASHNRAHLALHRILAVNLMGSPGAGKTALLEATARAIGTSRRLAAITGDLETDRDAVRLRAAGISAEAITTGSACHLDADMVHHALHRGALREADTLFIENVGNLVCPTSYDLGEHAKIVVLSVTEGEDKPLKYPSIFAVSELCIINKIDLLPYVPFDLGRALANVRQVHPGMAVVQTSCTKREGLDGWLQWVEKRRVQAMAE